jgi:drug/metabolite transporter (DMT)-like permease
MEVPIREVDVVFRNCKLRKNDISPPADLKFAATAGGLIFFASVLYSYSVGAIGAALTSAINAGVPIVNSVASYFLLGEKLDAHKYAAIALMVLGLVAIFI